MLDLLRSSFRHSSFRTLHSISDGIFPSAFAHNSLVRSDREYQYYLLLNRVPSQRLVEKMKVIGAGLGRTGTSSLVIALRELGYTPYHMLDGVEQTAGQLDRWVTYVEQLESGSAEAQKKALDQLVNSMVDEGFDATTDYPACLIYKQLMERFPEAKVVLTVRESGAKWAESVNATIGRGYTLTMNNSRGNSGRAVKFSKLTRYIWGNTPLVEADKENVFIPEALAQAHDNWRREVMAHVPKERLLVFQASMGWEPLCEFLGLPCPDKPFPKTNTREVLSGYFDNLEAKASEKAAKL